MLRIGPVGGRCWTGKVISWGLAVQEREAEPYASRYARSYGLAQGQRH
ncbi:MAG: hypothetical protein JWM02_1536 [Frankiales bacterium]|nr:hypothetical protein [Frankiales bacterium]